MSARQNVPRIGRILDLVGLLLFVLGGGVWLRAWFGFQQVRHYQPQPGDPLWSATHRANGFLRLQHLGMEVMAAGVAVFVVAWWVAGRASRAIPAPRPVSSDAADATTPTSEAT